MESDQKIVRREGEDGDQLGRAFLRKRRRKILRKSRGALLRKKRKGLRDELIYKQRLALFFHVANR